MLHAYEHAADAFTSTAQERSQESDDWWIARLAQPDQKIAFGAFVNGQILGTVAVEFSAKPKTKHKALVVGMYVLQESRRQGIAKSLMHSAIGACSSNQGILVVQLDVTDGNMPAEDLYKSLGFQRFGVEPMAILTPSGFKSKVHMWLSLGESANAV